MLQTTPSINLDVMELEQKIAPVFMFQMFSLCFSSFNQSLDFGYGAGHSYDHSYDHSGYSKSHFKFHYKSEFEVNHGHHGYEQSGYAKSQFKFHYKSDFDGHHAYKSHWKFWGGHKIDCGPPAPPPEPPCPPPPPEPPPPPPEPPCPPPPPEPPPPPPPEPPSEVIIDEASGGIYGDPHVDVLSQDGSVIKFDHYGYDGSSYNVFSGDDMEIHAKYETVGSDPWAPQYITEATVYVNGNVVTYDVDGNLTLNGEELVKPDRYDLGNGGYLQLNMDNEFGEHTIELHNDANSRVDFWTNGIEMKIDPSGSYEDGTLGGIIGDTFLANGTPDEVAQNGKDAYLITA